MMASLNVHIYNVHLSMSPFFIHVSPSKSIILSLSKIFMKIILRSRQSGSGVDLAHCCAIFHLAIFIYPNSARNLCPKYSKAGSTSVCYLGTRVFSKQISHLRRHIYQFVRHISRISGYLGTRVFSEEITG